MTGSDKIKFFFPKKARISNRTGLKRFIEKIFQYEKKLLGELNYVFCSDKELLKINQDFLKHDYYTDIVTFNLSEGPAIQGEVYISIDRVKDNAKSHSISFRHEIHRVIFHGALHLCGYRDKTVKEVKKMRQKEDFYLNLYLD